MMNSIDDTDNDIDIDFGGELQKLTQVTDMDVELDDFTMIGDDSDSGSHSALGLHQHQQRRSERITDVNFFNSFEDDFDDSDIE